MRVAVVQHDIVWEDKAANHATVEAMLDEADLPAGTLVVLPELGDTGFSFNLDTIVDDASLSWGMDQARARGIWLQIGYAIRGSDQRGRNCASIVNPDGKVACTYEKVHPFSFGREAEFFSGGEHLAMHACGELMVAPMICYDLRFPEVWRIAAIAGAECMTIGASWPDARQQHWRALLIARAIENQAFIVAVNRVGRDPHLGYAGGSMIISPMGDVLAEGKDQPTVLSADLDVESLRTWRSRFPALQDAMPDLLGAIPIRDHAASIDNSSPS
ncbi:MAG: nitrilase-related carbon-nitrogen hydrolase [Planctomycetota bacterium]